jgi:nucleoside-diphosphate-sugar epimerase
MRRREFLKTSLLAGAGAACASSIWAPGAWAAKPKKVLVLGGTLFLGPAIVETLVAEGHTVTLFNRGVTHPELFPYLEKLRGFRSADANNQDLTALAHRRFDAIIDVWPNDPEVVAPAAQFLKDKTAHYLFVSSVGAYDGSEYQKDVVTEGGATREWGPQRRGYGSNKAESERRLHGMVGERLTIVRPGPIKGKRDDGLDMVVWLLRAQEGGEHIAPGDGNDPVQFVDVKDVARFLVMAVARQIYGTFNLTERSMSFREFLEACKAATRSEASFTWVPQQFLHEHGLDPDDLVTTFAGALPFWRPKGSKPGPGLYRASSEKAYRAGWKTRPFEETASDALEFFYSAQLDRPNGLTSAKEKEVLEAWKNSSKRQ